MNKKVLLFTIIALIISGFVFLNKSTYLKKPVQLYRVYLSGETIGYIKSKDELNDYIDEKEDELKRKYNVNKIYAPKNLKIVKEITYNKKTDSVESMYNYIKEKAPFTIKGYVVTIKGVEDQDDEKKFMTDTISVNVLNKDIFIEALKKTVNVFIDEEKYNEYINDTPEIITDTGSIIENVYIENEIVVKESQISVDDIVFMDIELLSKYLLFGTLDNQKTYKVKSGDTIEQVSFDNKLSVEEFLIANTNFTSSDNLLYPGEIVNVASMKPTFKLIEEDHIVEVQNIKYRTEIVYDKSMYVGDEKIKQQGVNGSSKVTKKVKKSNGQIISAVVMSSEELTPTKNKIIIRGKKTVDNSYSKSSSINISSSGSWAWPTTTPYQITSNYGYRWGKLHAGIDITSTGYGSPIYAASDGVVTAASYTSTNGNYVAIKHANGLYTQYGHMSKLLVKKGQTVTIGQQIGKMGATGYAFGVHLHFGLWKGVPYRKGSTSINPLKVYK